MKWNPEPYTFPAQFSSTLDCGCEVEAGDEIGYGQDDNLCCTDCLAEAQ